MDLRDKIILKKEDAVKPSVWASAALCTVGWAASLQGQTVQQFEALRNKMVDEEIVAAGVKNDRVVKAMRDTPRHEFMPLQTRKFAYFDMGVAIGDGQTISSPFTVAFMTESLDPQATDKVLEIGTGSGYQAAVLSPLVHKVFTIEIVAALGRKAEQTLKRLKYDNVSVKVGDGFLGWAEHAPFDKIIVTCSPENVPQPLVDQLREGGRMVVPLGERYKQNLYLLKKVDGKLVREALLPTLFVPMTGKAENNRQVQPNPERPELVNGSFEANEAQKLYPDGWYYFRGAELVEDKLSPDGQRFLRFTNDQPGLECRALQAFAVDGRKVKQLAVTLRVRVEKSRPGPTLDQRPSLHVTFYDENRGVAGEDWLGPWSDTSGWIDVRGALRVPPKAREAILRIGLLGGTGVADFDAVTMQPLDK